MPASIPIPDLPHRSLKISQSHPAYFLYPSWILIDGPARLRAIDLDSRSSLELEGSVRKAVFEGGGAGNAELNLLSKLNKDAKAFRDALKATSPELLSRSRILRGSQYQILFVELTSRCNESCRHCYAESSPERKETLDPGIIPGVLEDAAQLKFETIQFTGGDPLIAPALLPAVEKALALNFPYIEIYTNGLALEGQLWRALESYPLSYAFSFYAAEPELHDRITRTPGSHKRTLAAIRKVLNAGKVARVGIVAMAANRHCIKETVALMRDTGFDEGSIHICEEKGVGRGEIAADLSSKEWPDSNGRGVEYGGGTEEAYFGKAAVSPTGDVFPCIFGRDRLLGNVHKQRLVDILGGDEPVFLDGIDFLTQTQCEAGRLACWDCRARAVLLNACKA